MNSNTAGASGVGPFCRRRDVPYFIRGWPERIYCQESSVVYERVELTFTGVLHVVDPSHAISRPSTKPGVFEELFYAEGNTMMAVAWVPSGSICAARRPVLHLGVWL
jgi:hypothetical protein